MLRLPKSLHEALAIQAEREGVSLNQLVLAMLSVSLRTSLGIDSTEERELIRKQALEAMK